MNKYISSFNRFEKALKQIAASETFCKRFEHATTDDVISGLGLHVAAEKIRFPVSALLCGDAS
ncbi:MAG: hypothetical protein R2847_09375 [Bacteroidia bacterium]